MILGPPGSPCFVELDEAVAQLQAARGDDRPVVFAWQLGEVPRGAIVYNLDLPGIHFGLGDMRALGDLAGEVWDFSRRGVAQWRAIGVDAKFVPVGYHPSMTRFERREPTIDVVFMGSMNERRHAVLQRLERAGFSVRIASGDRAERDELLAQCRCSLNMLFYPNGVYPSLRAAHLLANDVPYVGERSAECDWDPTSASFVDYDGLVDAIARCVASGRGGKSAFVERPLVLP